MPNTNNDICVLQRLAEVIRDNHALQAVWLDAQERKISFAHQPDADTESIRKKLESILAMKTLLKPSDCSKDGWRLSCQTCGNSKPDKLPPGLRLVSMPGSGVMLEKESCQTAPRFWKWQQFPWVKVQPRRLLDPAHLREAAEWKKAMAAAGVCGLGAATGFILESLHGEHSAAAIAAYLIAYIAGGWFPAVDVWELLRKRTLDVHFLMLFVAAGAAAVGHWWEGATLLFLFSSSGALEDLALFRTEREIKSLFKDAPKEANVVEPSGTEKRIPVEQLQPGMVIRTRPGEQFAADAEVLSGASAANESSLTGESVPVDKQCGDTVFSGTMNLWGAVDSRITKTADESSLAKIIRLIQEAQSSKAPSQQFTDKFGTRYTYAILTLTLVMFLVWWLVLGLSPFLDRPGEKSAFYRSMILLVVASPCALVLSIPSSILAGIAAGARRGVLFRGGAAIEKLGEIKRVALDKTGTLTTGELEVIGIETLPPGRANELLQVAASLSHHSSHPVSRAIALKGRGENLAFLPVEGFHSLTGMGVSGRVQGHAEEIQLGRRSLFEKLAWVKELPEPDIGVTETVVVAGELRGRILLLDTVREASAPLLRKLQSEGLRVTMLTGDRPEAAAKVAKQLGLEDVRSGLKPEDKVAFIQKCEMAGEHVAMVGDGVNDAPSLAAAYVAVGMGLRGSDAVLEQADVVLMQDRLENFKYAYELSRKANRIIKQNLAISLGVIAVLVVSALGSYIPLTLGVIGHEGSTVIVVLNSLRLLFFEEKKGNPGEFRSQN
ncbi:MAG: cation-translocating P-type ATPase [Methylacidiphilales bacterium]|nr:cation-translocating P-type ATPase [Candidatus Methylacidiphilales bacterium]